MSVRMRRPATARLELTQGDHLIVKQDLTAGEYRAYLKASTKPDAWELDPLASGAALVLAYLLDWSFCDADGKPLAIADQPRDVIAATLDHLDHDAYMEVQTAIQAHQQARAAVLADEKKNDHWRALTRQDLDLCRVMHWTYQDVQDLPQPIYDELVAYLLEEQAARP